MLAAGTAVVEVGWLLHPQSGGPGSGGTGQPPIPKVSHGWQGVGARTFPDPNKRDQKKSNVNLGCQNMQIGHCQVSVS